MDKYRSTVVVGEGEPRPSRSGLLATCSVLALAILEATGNAAPVTDPTLPFTNAGTITGILITHTPNPQGNIVNSGTITASSNPTAAGIQISGATTTLAGAIINSGAVQATASPLQIFENSTAFGVRVGTGTAGSAAVPALQGGFVNDAKGVISAMSLVNGYGIQLNASTFSGGITNAGTITGSGVIGFGVGISVLVTSFSGGITNSGTLTGFTTQGDAIGLELQGIGAGMSGSLGGPIINSGEVIGNGMGVGIGVADLVPTTSGGISNSGTILGFAGSGQTAGVLIAPFPFAIGATVPTAFIGGFVNNGKVSAGGQIGIGVQIGARSSSVALPTFQGGVINTSAGLITALAEFVGTGLQVTASSFSGGISNAGTISGFGQFGQGAGAIISTSTFVGGFNNSGTISGSGGTGVGLSVLGSSFGGGISNSGVIAGSGSAFFGRSVGVQVGTSNPLLNFQGGIINTTTGVIVGANVLAGTGLQVTAVNFSGGLTNAGTISGSGIGTAASGVGISVVTSSFSGGVTNSGLISGMGKAEGVGILLQADNGGSIGGPIVNSGTISAGASLAIGIWDQADTFTAGISNGGAVIAASNGSASAIGISLLSDQGGTHNPTLFVGGITNSGRIVATNGNGITSGINAGLQFGGAPSNQLTFQGGIVNAAGGLISAASASGGVFGVKVALGNFSGGLTNAGTISGFGGGFGRAILIDMGGAGVSFMGGITNIGLLTGDIGLGLENSISIGGGITNTGTITATTAIDFTSNAGQSNTFIQTAGAINGAVKLSANADQVILTGGVLNGQVTALAGNHAVISVPSGTATLAPTSGISSVSSFTQTGGTLALQLTSNTAAGTFPAVNAGAINLNGALLASLQGNLAAFATSPVYEDVFVSGAPITGTETVTTSSTLFSAALVPDATTVNALDLSVALSPTVEALTAQVLAQALRFGMVGQQNAIDTIENRLQVGRSEQGPGLQFASARGDRLAVSDADQQTQVPVGGSGEGFAMWGRAYGTAGGAPATGTLPGFGEGRIGGIVGADWRFDQLVVGGAFHYAHTEAPFDDGSKTRLEDYQGIVYGGWREGPAYVTALASGGANDYTISRNLTPFGLTGFATSAPTGSLVSAFGEVGYALDWNGTDLTPYVNLDYIHQHVDAFTEAGAFGAFGVAPANGSSLTTTLGLRASTRIDLGSHGTLVPEVRAGWSHEFLDASQTLTAQLVGTAASPFAVVGTSFGRDSAVVGVGVSHEFAPGASFFMDYDGQFTGGFNQNSGSVGIKIKF
jgi:outer membrane autotransporter protein